MKLIKRLCLCMVAVLIFNTISWNSIEALADEMPVRRGAEGKVPEISDGSFFMTEKSYMEYSAFEEPINIDNPDCTFKLLDGATVTSAAQNKPKLLVFFSNQCQNSRNTVKAMSKADFSDVDVIYVNTNTDGNEQMTKSFKSGYGNDDMLFSAYSANNRSAMWKYVRKKFGYVSSATWPVIAYIDKDNKLNQVTMGQQAARTIRENIKYYCYHNTESGISHNHIYESKWTTDEQQHWHTCVAEGCDGTVSDKGTHTAGDWIVDREATAQEEGSRHRECTVCGYILQTESIDKLASEPGTTPEPAQKDDEGNALSIDGWHKVNGINYWYEGGVRQGYDPDNAEYRGKEIYDKDTGAWYWLDNVQQGAVAKNKDVYQESQAGQWGAGTNENGEKVGKWVRYDADGHMVKGWQTTENGTYYFDLTYGTMAKGNAVIDGKNYYFNMDTGILEGETQTKDDDGGELSVDGWHKVNGINYWYEGGVRQGYDPDNAEYRGKEIYDKDTGAWYWLDNVQQGAVAKNKDVYQESQAGQWGAGTNENGEKVGKWVRYDADGHMVKGWQTTENGTYYFDLTYGTMAKGNAVIDGMSYYFDINTGILQ